MRSGAKTAAAALRASYAAGISAPAGVPTIPIGEKVISFTTLLEMLVTPTQKLKGAPVLVPELILFQSGRPKCVIRYDKQDNEVKRVSNSTALQLPKLMKYMMSEHRLRKRGNDRVSAPAAMAKRESTTMKVWERRTIRGRTRRR